MPDTNPAAATGAGASYEGFVVIVIADKEFQLSGKVGTEVVVEYHQPYNQAILLGTFADMIGTIGSALGMPDDFRDKIKAVIETIGELPGVGKIFDILVNSPLRITDLEINTKTKRYQFGFAFDLSDKNVAIGEAGKGIKLQAFGLRITYDKGTGEAAGVPAPV